MAVEFQANEYSMTVKSERPKVDEVRIGRI